MKVRRMRRVASATLGTVAAVAAGIFAGAVPGLAMADARPTGPWEVAATDWGSVVTGSDGHSGLGQTRA